MQLLNPKMKTNFLLFLLLEFLLAFPLVAQTEAWQNPEVNALNRESMRSAFFPFPDVASATREKEQAENFESLNGLWKFRWVAKPSEVPAGFEQLIFEDFHWDNLLLPSNWELKNYGTAIFTDSSYAFQAIKEDGRWEPADAGKLPEDNPVGLYRRTIELKPGWKGRKVFLHLEAVSGGITVYCNGRKVGYSEDSRLPAEFDLSSYLSEGKNVLAFRVQRFSDGSFLEGWPGWQLGGFLGDAYLFATPKTWIRDFTLRTDFDPLSLNGRFDLDLVLHSSEGKPQAKNLICKILDTYGKERWQKAHSCTSLPNQSLPIKGQFLGNLDKTEAWSPEKPALHTLEIQVLDPGTGAVQECIRHRFGFQKTSIENGKWTWNGKNVQIKGVRWQAHDPEDGGLVSSALLEKEIRTMKQLNLNTLLLEGPAPQALYDLCNQYGLWVIDAANTCPSIGLRKGVQAITVLPNWKKAWIERSQRLYDRDKNQTCVLAWLTAPFGTQGSNPVSAAEILGQLDSRPVLNTTPEIGILEVADHSHEALHSQVDNWRQKHPKALTLIDQIPTSGKVLASLKSAFDSLQRQPHFLGGILTQWKDLGIRRYENGNPVLVYGLPVVPGGQGKERGLCDEEIRPHPQAEWAQILFSPFQMKINLLSNKLEIRLHNTLASKSLPKSVLVISRTGVKESVRQTIPAIKAGEFYTLSIPFKSKATGQETGKDFQMEWLEKTDPDKMGNLLNRWGAKPR